LADARLKITGLPDGRSLRPVKNWGKYC